MYIEKEQLQLLLKYIEKMCNVDSSKIELKSKFYKIKL